MVSYLAQSRRAALSRLQPRRASRSVRVYSASRPLVVAVKGGSGQSCSSSIGGINFTGWLTVAHEAISRAARSIA